MSNIQLVQRTNNPHNGFVKLTGSGSSIYADSLPPPTSDPDGRDGWLYQKTSGAEKFNYYFYSQGSSAFNLSHIKSLFFTGSVDNWVSIGSAPFIVIYTKPTGSGDAGAWYHSKVAYTISASSDIQLGELSYFYAGLKPTHITSSYRHILLNNKVITGDALPSEEVLTIAVHSDSSAANSTRILITDMGFQTHLSKITRNIKLIA